MLDTIAADKPRVTMLGYSRDLRLLNDEAIISRVRYENFHLGSPGYPTTPPRPSGHDLIRPPSRIGGQRLFRCFVYMPNRFRYHRQRVRSRGIHAERLSTPVMHVRCPDTPDSNPLAALCAMA